MCDAQYKFVPVDIGAKGKQSDGVLRNYEFGKLLSINNLNFPPARPTEQGDENMPYFVDHTKYQ